MQKRTSILFLLVVFVIVFSSCRDLSPEPVDLKDSELTKKEISPLVEQYSHLLTTIPWEVDSMGYETTDMGGAVTSRSMYSFGPGTSMGTCYFTFDPGGDFVMLDNGTPYPDTWELRFRQLAIGIMDYQIERLDDKHLIFENRSSTNPNFVQSELWYLTPRTN